MILKNSVIAVIFCIAWIDGVFGTSYSKVYVNSGSNGPYQYAGYGAPVVAYNAPIAQLSAAPIGSVVPYPQAASFVAPCVSPCAPQQPVAPVTNAGLVAYTAPRAVVVAKDVPTNYEYSYVVYDDGTGDQKAARELSDGGVVRGQYSFLQPDGYVREVQYTADDVTGFNAVVNYLPGNVQKTVEVKQAKPCPDVKSEALKKAEDPKEKPSSDGEKSGKQDSKSSEELPTSAEKPVKETSSEEKSPEKSSEETSAESTPEKPAPETPAPEAPTPKAPAPEAPAPEAPAPEAPAPEAPAPEAPAPEAPAPEGSAPEAPAPKSKEEGSKEETPAAVDSPKEGEANPESTKKTEPSSEAVLAEVKEDKTQVVENAKVEAVEAPQPASAIITNTLPPGYVSYEQLLKCIQKMQNADLRINSPLTYILLPSNAKPC